jgi:hypothetical protein
MMSYLVFDKKRQHAITPGRANVRSPQSDSVLLSELASSNISKRAVGLTLEVGLDMGMIMGFGLQNTSVESMVVNDSTTDTVGKNSILTSTCAWS